MSWVDDITAEREAAIRNATARIAHGKHFPARQLAQDISIVGQLLVKEYGTLENTLERLRTFNLLAPSSEPDRATFLLAQTRALDLLAVTLINPKALHLIADAFRKLEDTGAIDLRAMAIINAYEDCESFPPTFGELKRKFIARSGEDRWRGDFPVRDTLRFLKLPLRESKRGRPPGAKSALKAWGIRQVRSSQKRRKISNRKR
jgi:hypothetical protein